MRQNYVWITLLIVFGVCGCTPHEIEIALASKSIDDVVSGRVSSADLTISFVNDMGNAREKLPQIREVVTPYLDKSGKLTIRGEKVTAKFKVPFMLKDKFDSCHDKTVARLVLDAGRLQLIESPNLKGLNRDLKAIDFTIDVDLKAKHLVYKIVGDESTNCTVKATAVFVDGEPHVNFAKQLAADDSVDIEFRCDTDASVWHQITPYIEIK